MSAQHIPGGGGGADNGAADALSRNDLMQVAGARRDPTLIPPDLLEALLLHPQDWTSQSWTRLLLAPWRRKASQSSLTGCTAVPKNDFEILRGSWADTGPCIRGSTVFIRGSSPGTTSQT